MMPAAWLPLILHGMALPAAAVSYIGPRVRPHAGYGADTLAGLNALDWALVLLLAFSAATGFMRGLIRSVVSLVGLGLGIVLAAWYAPAAAVWLGRWVRQGQWAQQAMLAEVVAFAGTVAAVYVLASLVGRVLRSASHAVGLGFFDRLGGALFGAVRTVLVLAAVLLPLRSFLPMIPFTRESTLLPYLRSAAVGVSFVVPQDFGNRLASEVGQSLPWTAAPAGIHVPEETRRPAAHSTDRGERP